MTLHFTSRILYDQQRRVAAARPGINTLQTTKPKTTPFDFDASARFNAVLAMARKHGEEFAAGYLASKVVGLEAELKLSKQQHQSAVQQLHEYVEAEGE